MNVVIIDIYNETSNIINSIIVINLKEESERKLNYYKERKDKITEKIRN